LSQTGLVTGACYLDHDTGPSHPESPERLNAILHRLRASPVWNNLKLLDPQPVELSELTLVHHFGYVRSVEEKCGGGLSVLDRGDTVVCPESYQVALKAVGGVVLAVEKVFASEIFNAFCAVRPPGHHAEREEVMGFCLFNNAAIAARVAQKLFGAERILILDWDVHHGNGTQHIFESDPTVHYISIHQYPFYPGTGAKKEIGVGEGLGATTNFPLDAGGGDEIYLDIFNNALPDIVMGFKPDFIILSAGFDAHVLDPLANMNVSTECFYRMTEVMTALAAEICHGKLVSILEGGYDLQGLSESVEAHLTQLCEAADG
tara:strand:- start:3485 stop:4438 length:954 start_codon:yes stop_codon:yes gene_type:complete